MPMKRALSPILFAGLLLSFACQTNSSVDYSDLPNDSLTVEKGKALFLQNCSACHDFRQDGIGPQLGGLTRQVSVAWLRDFIAEPIAMIDRGDEGSNALLSEYSSIMPSFAHVGEGNIGALITYLHTIQATAPTDGGNEWEEMVE